MRVCISEAQKYTGQTIAQCDNIVVLPHIIEGVSIYNNIVENTGWDGIQVSSAPVNCNVLIISFVTIPMKKSHTKCLVFL